MTGKVLLRKLAELERCLDGLELMRGYDINAFRGNIEKQWAVERGL